MPLAVALGPLGGTWTWLRFQVQRLLAARCVPLVLRGTSFPASETVQSEGSGAEKNVHRIRPWSMGIVHNRHWLPLE